MSVPGVELYVGGHGLRYGAGADALLDLDGRRCCSAAHRPFGGRQTQLWNRLSLERLQVLLDSGAFSDPPARRLTPAAALERQLAWEATMAARWETPGWRVQALASYDLLVDEWRGGRRGKDRWSVNEARAAVATTIEAARFLASQRTRLAPRTLVLACQGVDAPQYVECVQAVLDVACPGDWIGLGGWCILGRWQRRWLPIFWATLQAILPLIAAAGIRHVHLFGVLWLPALGGLLWLADQYGLEVSTDSARPLRDVSGRNPRKAGARGTTWRDSVAWWRRATAELRASPYYRPPQMIVPHRQLTLFGD